MSNPNQDSNEEEEIAPSLPKLLAALALGVRSVNALPFSTTRDDDDDSASENEDEDDEFAYQMSFPEFRSLCLELHSQVAALLSQSLQSAAATDSMVDDYEFDDPQLWEHAAEACDVLLERADMHIQNVKEGRVGMDDEKLGEAIVDVGRFGDIARNKAKGGFDQIVGSLVDMEVRSFAFAYCDKSSSRVHLTNQLSHYRNRKSLIISRVQYRTRGQSPLFRSCTGINHSL